MATTPPLPKKVTRPDGPDLFGHPQHLAYQLRIQLLGLRPTIYRDVLVDPSMKLPKLHQVIQAAMGWDDEHLHAFALPVKGESFWKVPGERRFEARSFDGFAGHTQTESRFQLQDLLQTPKSKLLYLYDFGDDWEHSITLTKVVETPLPLPYLLKAQNACPPDSCGGPPGADHWASAWYDEDDPDHEIALDMFGDHEPGWLDFEALQKAVQRLQPRTKAKKA